MQPPAVLGLQLLCCKQAGHRSHPSPRGTPASPLLSSAPAQQAEALVSPCPPTAAWQAAALALGPRPPARRAAQGAPAHMHVPALGPVLEVASWQFSCAGRLARQQLRGPAQAARAAARQAALRALAPALEHSSAAGQPAWPRGDAGRHSVQEVLAAAPLAPQAALRDPSLSLAAGVPAWPRGPAHRPRAAAWLRHCEQPALRPQPQPPARAASPARAAQQRATAARRAALPRRRPARRGPPAAGRRPRMRSHRW